MEENSASRQLDAFLPAPYYVSSVSHPRQSHIERRRAGLMVLTGAQEKRAHHRRSPSPAFSNMSGMSGRGGGALSLGKERFQVRARQRRR